MLNKLWWHFGHQVVRVVIFVAKICRYSMAPSCKRCCHISYWKKKCKRIIQNQKWQRGLDCLAYKQSFVGVIVSLCASVWWCSHSPSSILSCCLSDGSVTIRRRHKVTLAGEQKLLTVLKLRGQLIYLLTYQIFWFFIYNRPYIYIILHTL